MTDTRVLYVAQGGKAVPWEVPVRDLEPNQVRVRVHSVGINPIDWKTIDNNLADGAGQGNDFAGEVVEVGSEVKSVKVGDSVAGGVGGGDVDKKENGAFTPLLNVEEHLLFRFPAQLKDEHATEIPHGIPTTYQQAASLGIALDTTALAFDGLAPQSDEWALVYGSSSSLGFIAMQFARNIGYNVIAVSSPHADLYRDLGVHFVDRHDADWPAKARELAKGRITFAFDTIGLDGSPQRCFEALADKAVLSLCDPGVQLDASVLSTKPDVKVRKPLYFLVMQPVKKFGTAALNDDEGHYKRAPELIERINAQLRQNEIVALPITVLPGLERIGEGLDLNRKGVSGRKVVVDVVVNSV